MSRLAAARRTSHSRRATLRRSLFLIVGLGVVALLSLLALAVGQSSLRAAESERLSERRDLMNRLATAVGRAYDPAQLQPAVDRAPFSPSSPELNTLLLRQFTTTPTGDPARFVTLLGRDGRPLASIGTGTPPSPAAFSRFWTRALAGTAVPTSLFDHDGAVLRADLVPVGGADPWAVLVIVPENFTGQQFMEKLGSLGSGSGGIVTFDRGGRISGSYDNRPVGSPALSPAEVAALPRDGGRVWKVGELTRIASCVPGVEMCELFEIRTADLYSDLRSQERRRTLTILAVLAACLIGMAVLGFRRERAARRDEKRLQSLLTSSRDLIAVVGNDGVARFVSPSIEPLLGQDPTAWGQRPLAELVHPDDRERLAAILAPPVGGQLLNVRLLAADGSERWFDLTAVDASAHPELGGALLTFYEVGQRKDLQDRLTHAATHDELTGLPHRAVFVDRIRAALVGNTGFAVLFVDLDHFKPVNDTLGHEAGDAVLRTVSERLRAVLAAAPSALVCRFGGDEFGVLLDTAERGLAQQIATRLVSAVRQPIAVGTTLVHIDASIGIRAVENPSLALDVDGLIRDADAAMYEAKAAGRGRTAFADEPSTVVVPAPRRDDPVIVAPRTPLEAQPTAGWTGAVGPRAAANPEPSPVSPPASRPAAPGSVPPSPPSSPLLRRSWFARLGPLLVAGVLLIGIAAIGGLQQYKARQVAEDRRVEVRTQVTGRVAEYLAALRDPSRLLGPINDAPWNLEQPAANGLVLSAIGSSAAAGANSVVVLLDPDGKPLVSEPAAATTALAPTDPAFAAARAGKATMTRTYEEPSGLRQYTVVPIVRDGRTVRILAISSSVRSSTLGPLAEAIGSFGFGEGGISLLDGSGVAVASWDPNLVGRRLVETPRALLPGARPGEARRISAAESGKVALLAATATDGGYLLYAQDDDVFFEDLRDGQLTRVLLLVGIVGAGVLGLAGLHLHRERLLRRSEARLHALLHSASDIVLCVDRSGRLSFVSSAVETLLDRRSEDLVGRPVAELVDEDDRSRLAMAMGRGGGGTASLHDIRLAAADGSTRWFDVDVVDLHGDPTVAGVLLTCHESSQRRNLQEQLSESARTDTLTGLPNRATFAAHLTELTRLGCERFAVLFVDLDHFKPINDTYGHDAGDLVLQTVATRLRSVVRGPEDGSGCGGPDLVCRLGGDEFVVVLHEADEAVAGLLAARILDLLQVPMTLGEASVAIGATIGIALSHPDHAGPDVVVRNADSAMYRAKSAGRGRYAVFADPV